VPVEEREFVIIGGGVVGAALGWNLARVGKDVLVLDGEDLDARASRANLGLVWVSGKGAGAPAYARWSLGAAQLWPQLAEMLLQDTGIDVQLRQGGGFSFALSEQEFGQLRSEAETIARETNGELGDFEILDGDEARSRVPFLGSEVTGAIFCPHDGHVNSLRLLAAFHTGLLNRGAEYRMNRVVSDIEPLQQGFRIRGAWGSLIASKLVLAAGLDNARLAPMVGLSAPLVLSKGQVIVTEKCLPFLAHATAMLRQNEEGSILIGESEETNTDSIAVNHEIGAALASRAIRTFPAIADLNIVRSWTGFRVKTPDGLPIYEQSETCPEAFMALCHSGVTLAAQHALCVAPQIAARALGQDLDAFSASRFHAA